MSKSQSKNCALIWDTRKIDSKTQSIASIAIKKLYLMFLKYKQTQRAQKMGMRLYPDYIQNSSSGSWNQVPPK